jgi:4-hydroxy-L-threonine phosphate dehydrogenase PdxA
MSHYVFTCGDINGIGPEICLKTFNKIFPNKNLKITYICPRNIFLESCKLISPKFEFKITDNIIIDSNFGPSVTIFDIDKAKYSPGKPTKSAGKLSFNAVVTAIQMVQNNLADAIVTAPISKTALNLAGIDFTGHTEILAKYTNTKKYVMTFLSTKMKCALTTIHIPVNKISKTLTQKKLRSAINVCINSLRCDLGIANPKIAVLALKSSCR